MSTERAACCLTAGDGRGARSAYCSAVDHRPRRCRSTSESHVTQSCTLYSALHSTGLHVPSVCIACIKAWLLSSFSCALQGQQEVNDGGAEEDADDHHTEYSE